MQERFLVVEYLISKGADVNSVNHYNYTPLLWAAIRGNLRTAELMLEKSSDVNLRDIIEGRTPLEWNKQMRHMEVKRLFEEKLQMILIQKGIKKIVHSYLLGNCLRVKLICCLCLFQYQGF